MHTLAHLKRLFAYEWWANADVVAALGRIPEPPAKAVELMAHIVAAQRLWLERLQQVPQSTPVWPQLSVVQCREQLADLRVRWERYLDRLRLDGLRASIAYTNTKGEAHHSLVEDVLTHVAMHSAYHRGQIASVLRAAGHQPPYTDYIHATRRGHVAPPEDAP
jgi:uncharacterized damage-inducible protein DinB